MWGLLTDISDQLTHCDEKWEAEAWKACFLKAMGKKLTFMPSARWRRGSRGRLSRRRSSTRPSSARLIELIYSEYGARKRGVRLSRGGRMSVDRYSDADLVRAVQAERKACVDLVWLESARHKAAEAEAEDRGEDEEAERHKWDAEALKRVAEAIEKRGAKAP